MPLPNGYIDLRSDTVLVALDSMIHRLAEDHANARRLAEGLARLKARGVLVGPRSARRFRAVTHYWVSAGDVEAAVAAFGDALR